MTIRTVTYDDRTHKICPIEPTDEMLYELSFCGEEGLDNIAACYKKALAAAPEYQDTCTDGGKCGIGGYCESYTKEPTKDE